MKISIVIPAYNEEKYIGETLKSIIDSATDNLLEIVVVNNASTDNTVSVASAFPKVKVVEERRKGLTRARQLGLMTAQGEILSYIDADTHVTKEWFKTLNEEFSKDPSLVCLSGPYEYYDLPAFKQWLVRIWNTVAGVIPWIIQTPVIMGGNFSAKKTALLQAGKFDETIQFYGEDTDIARRLKQVGKVKFTYRFPVETSARRFKEEGFFNIGFKYLINYFSVIVFKKPVGGKYRDVR
jgi:glycosyltransferase involved in cell wall biosynthesis